MCAKQCRLASTPPLPAIPERPRAAQSRGSRHLRPALISSLPPSTASSSASSSTCRATRRRRLSAYAFYARANARRQKPVGLPRGHRHRESFRARLATGSVIEVEIHDRGKVKFGLLGVHKLDRVARSKVGRVMRTILPLWHVLHEATGGRIEGTWVRELFWARRVGSGFSKEPQEFESRRLTWCCPHGRTRLWP